MVPAEGGSRPLQVPSAGRDTVLIIAVSGFPSTKTSPRAASVADADPSTVDEAGYASHFEMANFLAGVRSTVYTKAPVGLMYPGDDGYPGTSYNRGHLAQLAPRLGVVWDPSGSGQ